MTEDTPHERGHGGSWLVTEYVYSPSGAFLGAIRQRRQVELVEPGRIRVVLDWALGAELAGGAMEAFAGHHVFDMIADGRARRYLGPAVLGTGLTWGEGAMTGKGLWPEVGHDFSTFAVVSEPGLQFTGAKFFNGPEMVANLVGVAVPESADEPAWPELSGTQLAHEVATEWTGSLRTVDAQGELNSEVALIRRYTETSEALEFKEFRDGRGSALRLAIEDDGGHLHVGGRSLRSPFQGLGKRYGWGTELTLYLPAGRRVDWMEVLDAGRGRLVGLRRWWADGALYRVEVMTLRPKGTANPDIA